MLLIIWIILILSGILLKDSRVVLLLQLIFAILMITFNNGSADQLAYINNLSVLQGNSSAIFNGNFLFNIIFYIFGTIGGYNFAIFVISIISFLFLYKGIKFYTSNISFVMSLYLISPFVIDATQFRNFMAMCIWVYFSKYLYLAYQAGKFDKNAVFYLLGTTIAVLVHFAFLFSYIFIFSIYIKDKGIRSGLKVICILGILLIGFNNIPFLRLLMSSSNISILQMTASKFNDYGLNYNLKSASARLKSTVFFFVLIFIVFLIIYLLMKSNKMCLPELYKFVFSVTVISLLILPLLQYSMEIYRIQRNLLVIYYVLIGYLLNGSVFDVEHKKMYISRWLYCNLGVVVSIFYLLFDSVIWNFDSVFKVLFKL